MRNLSRAIIGVVLLASFASGQKKSNEVTITGEVVETQCYVTGLSGSGKGITHKECALTCAKNGIPLSILEDGTNQSSLPARLKRPRAELTRCSSTMWPTKLRLREEHLKRAG